MPVIDQHTAPDRYGELKPILETIARFAEPQAHLNKLGVKVPGQFAISIKRTTGRSKTWRAYWHDTGQPFVNERGEQLKSEFFISLKTEIAGCFNKVVQTWEDFTE